MAFDPRRMVLLSNGDGQKLYLYRTPDAIAAIAAADYFLPFQGQLDPDDLVLAVGSTGGARTVDLLVVTAASPAAVTVTNGT